MEEKPGSISVRPGGKETARMVKTLARGVGQTRLRQPQPHAADRRRCRQLQPAQYLAARATIPSMAKFLSRRLLNKRGLREGNLACRIRSRRLRSRLRRRRLPSACFPTNDPGAGRGVITALGAPPDFPIGGSTLRDLLTDDVSLSPAPGHAVRVVLLHHRRRTAGEGARPGAPARTRTAMRRRSMFWRRSQKFPGIRPDPEAFVEALDPLQPRLYSISSSHNATPGRVSLTVDTVRYVIGEPRPAGRRLDLACRAHRAGRRTAGLCAEGARLRPAGRSERAHHHDRTRHRRRAVPRLSARRARPSRRRAATGCSSAISAATAISSMKTNSKHESLAAC